MSLAQIIENDQDFDKIFNERTAEKAKQLNTTPLEIKKRCTFNENTYLWMCPKNFNNNMSNMKKMVIVLVICLLLIYLYRKFKN
jgi:hypothetical protein